MTKEILQGKIHDIVSIHGELSSARDLVPSPIINTSFSKLVSIVDTTPADSSKEILSDGKIAAIQQSLRRLSSQGESELERFWTERILASNHVHATLIQFPYFENYERMTNFEVEGMKSCNLHDSHKLLFVGSGPLPLSSIIMAGKHGYYIDNLEIDKKACDLSIELIKALNLSEKVKVIHKNIFDITDFSEYKSVFIAALAGKDETEKKRIIEHVVYYAEKGTHIVLRNASDLGTLLYPEITVDHLKNIDVVKKYDRPNGVINSIIVGKTK
jgi:nicotianamine synthase